MFNCPSLTIHEIFCKLYCTINFFSEKRSHNRSEKCSKTQNRVDGPYPGWVPIGTLGMPIGTLRMPIGTPNFGSIPCAFPTRFLCFWVF